jgi:hypothetical protein
MALQRNNMGWRLTALIDLPLRPENLDSVVSRTPARGTYYVKCVAADPLLVVVSSPTTLVNDQQRPTTTIKERVDFTYKIATGTQREYFIS